MSKRKHQKVIHHFQKVKHRITVRPLGKRPQLADKVKQQMTSYVLSESSVGHSNTTRNSKKVGQKLDLLCLVFHHMTTSLDVTFVQRLVGYKMRKIILKFAKLKIKISKIWEYS